MFVGVARLTLQIPDSGSLKAKRQVLRRVTDRLKARFNAAIAEVDDNDLWQKAVIAVAVVGNEARHVSEQLEKIVHFVDEIYVAPLIDRQTEIIPLGDRLYGRGALSGSSNADPPGEGEEPFDPDQEEFDLPVARGDRSLAEAEGLGDWEHRHGAQKQGKSAAASGHERPPSKLSLDEARKRARSLRNPREWEKK